MAEAERLVTIRLVRDMNRKLERIMAKLDDLLDAVAAQQTRIDSLETFIVGLKKKIDEALGGGLTPSQQMRIDALFNEVTKNSADIDAAMAENVADPIPAPEPVNPAPAPEKTATSTTISSSLNPSAPGDAITISAGVSAADGSAIGGSVAFYADDKAIGEAGVTDGVATVTVSPPEGEHDLTASYSGDSTHAPSASTEITQVVKASTPPAPATPEPAPVDPAAGNG